MRKDRGNATEYSTENYAMNPAMQGNPAYADFGYMPTPVKRPRRMLPRLIVFLVIVTAILIILQSVVFRLKTVYIVGNDTISADYIVSLSGLKKGESIVSVSEDTVRDNLETDQWLELDHLYKQYPNTVYLIVDEREVIACLRYLGIEYTLDLDGMVLQEYTSMDYEGDVPKVYGFKIGSVNVGQELNVNNSAQLTAYSAIVSELNIQQYADQIVSINLSDVDSLSLETKYGITVELGNSNYMRAKIGAMRTDIAYLQQLGETSGTLDVSLPEDGKFRRE